MGISNDLPGEARENLEIPLGQETTPVWNWERALATLALFSLGFVVLFILQAWLLTDRFGEALLDFGENNDITASLVILTFLGLTAVCIGSIWLVVIVWGKRSWRDLGFRPISRRWLKISVWLAAILVVVRVILGTSLALRYPSLAEGMDDLLFTEGNDLFTNLGMLVLIGILVPIWEELFFRGFLYKWFRNRMSVWVAIGFSALLFGAFHLIPLQMFLAAVMGIALAWIYERSDTLWAPIIMHAVNNLIVGVFAILLLFIESTI